MASRDERRVTERSPWEPATSEFPMPNVRSAPIPGPEPRHLREPSRQDFRTELVAWRPASVDLGSVSADREAHLVSAPRNGLLLRRVFLVLRTTHEPDEDAYWSILAFWRHADGTDQELGGITSALYEIEANKLRAVWHVDGGMRLERNHEVTVKFVKTGSPTALDGVGLQADCYVGI